MAQKIRLGDEVIVISGNGASSKVRGKVTKVLKREHKVIVEGYNKVKRAVKSNPNLGQEGGIVEREAPVDVSNVAIFNPETQKADRVGFKIEDGKKVRVFKSTGKEIK